MPHHTRDQAEQPSPIPHAIWWIRSQACLVLQLTGKATFLKLIILQTTWGSFTVASLGTQGCIILPHHPHKDWWLTQAKGDFFSPKTTYFSAANNEAVSLLPGKSLLWFQSLSQWSYLMRNSQWQNLISETVMMPPLMFLIATIEDFLVLHLNRWGVDPCTGLIFLYVQTHIHTPPS